MSMYWAHNLLILPLPYQYVMLCDSAFLWPELKLERGSGLMTMLNDLRCLVTPVMGSQGIFFAWLWETKGV